MFSSFFNKVKDYTHKISDLELSVDKEKQNFIEIYERNLVLEQEIQSRTKELGQANKSILALNNILNTINSSSPLSEVLNRIANGVCSDLGYAYSVILRFYDDEDGGYLKIRAVSESKITKDLENIMGKPLELLEMPMSSKKNPIVQVAKTKQMINVSQNVDLFKDNNFDLDDSQKNKLAEVLKNFSVILLPIKKSEDLFGVLAVVSPRKDVLETEINFLNLFAHQIEIGVTIADLFETIKKQAVTDGLTGLYNRRYFDTCLQKEAERSQRLKQPFSLITLDLDHLKQINDTFGHAIGDVAISTIAKVLKQKARTIDMASRFGGEEFGVVLPGIDSAGAVIAAERIREAIEAEPIEQVNKVTASIGVVTFGEHTENIDELLEMADKAMYKAKKSGRNQVKLAEVEDKANWVDIALTTFIEILELDEEKELVKKIDPKLIEQLKSIPAKEKGASGRIFNIVDNIVKNYDPMHEEGVTRKKVHMAVKLAKEVQLDSEEIDKIKLAVMLYDMGNLLLPEDILLKPGPLSKAEQKKIAQHPTMAVKQILRPIKNKKMKGILPLVQSHHERWDGEGYPEKLVGEEIPVGARIIVIIDAYFALINDRPYRKAYSEKEAIKILQEGANTRWDGRLVEIFIQIVQREED